MQQKRLWLIGLALFTTLTIGFWGRIPASSALLAAQAQTPSPASPSPTVTPEATLSPPASPSPTVTPKPVLSPSASPSATVTPKPVRSPPASPSPAVTPEPVLNPPAPASPTAPPLPPPPPLPIPRVAPAAPPSPSDTLLSAPPLPLGGNFEDSRGRFQVGILSGYKVGSAGRYPLFEAPDGSLAYTVVVRLRATQQLLAPSAIAQIAIETFQQGEGFQPGEISTLSPSETMIPWTGRLTVGAQAQPMKGVILASQPQKDILLLLIAATEEGSKQIPGAIAALAETLQPRSN